MSAPADFEQYRECLGLLGRMQLDEQLAAKVDVSCRGMSIVKNHSTRP